MKSIYSKSWCVLLYRFQSNVLHIAGAKRTNNSATPDSFRTQTLHRCFSETAQNLDPKTKYIPAGKVVIMRSGSPLCALQRDPHINILCPMEWIARAARTKSCANLITNYRRTTRDIECAPQTGCTRGLVATPRPSAIGQHVNRDHQFARPMSRFNALPRRPPHRCLMERKMKGIYTGKTGVATHLYTAGVAKSWWLCVYMHFDCIITESLQWPRTS